MYLKGITQAKNPINKNITVRYGLSVNCGFGLIEKKENSCRPIAIKGYCMFLLL